MKPSPIFLLSLPRSGSTMLQRLIAAHPEVATTSEPWLLLPALSALRRDAAFADYGHFTASVAISDFCENLPGGEQQYLDAVREFALDMYAAVTPPGVPYFLDKTPRYHFVADELVRAFPDAKYVFLWRNPVAVIASMIDTFGNGKWNLFRYRGDLYDGLDRLVALQDRLGDRAISLRYEDLIEQPAKAMRRVCEYLDVAPDDDIVDQFSEVNLTGSLGDQVGTANYTQLNSDPLEKWRVTLANPVRRRWVRRYLDWLGAGRLAAMGYDLDTLRSSLAQIESGYHGAASDAARQLAGVVWYTLEIDGWREKRRHLKQHDRLVVHT